MLGEFNADRKWREVLQSEIDKEHNYLVWKEWLELVWKLPTTEEVKIRADQVDYDGLPFEYLKVYGPMHGK